MGLKDKLNRLSVHGNSEPPYLKVIDGVSKLLSAGRNRQDGMDVGDEPTSDTETFLRFLAEYVKELRKGD